MLAGFRSKEEESLERISALEAALTEAQFAAKRAEEEIEARLGTAERSDREGGAGSELP